MKSRLPREDKFSMFTLVVVVFFFSSTLWIFGPAYIYFTNFLEFNYTFSQLAPYVLFITVVSAILLISLLYLFRKKSFKRSISLLFMLSVLLWIQGNYLVWDYGLLDGREIHWHEKVGLGIIDSGIWIILIIATQVKPGFFYKISRESSLALIVIQFIAVSMTAIQAPEVPSFKYLRIDDSTKFSFSSQKNAIILVLDTFQSDLFQEIITEDEKYKKIFCDFIYFRNALCSFPKTYGSVPAFLTAHVYDNSIPMQEFLQKAYLSNSSLPRILKEEGYRVELYPSPNAEKIIYFSELLASNIKRRTSFRMMWEKLGFLLDISLFRQMPHFLKASIYNNQAWLLKRLLSAPLLSDKKAGTAPGSERFSKKALQAADILFIKQMLEETTVDTDSPVFKFYHLQGPHRPLNLDENLEYRLMPYNQRSSFKTHGKACLQITRLFLEKLKRIEQYDNSLIIVMADHGCADYPYGVEIRGTGLEEKQLSRVKIPSHIKAAGLPLLLVKPTKARASELKITDAPVSLKDIPATVVKSLGLTRPMLGQSMLDFRQSDFQERRFYYYNWSGDFDYFYHMREYIIRGHAWLDSSWHELGMKRPATAKTPYQFGTVVEFKIGGNAKLYQGIGWHGPQKSGFTWTREKTAELFFTLEPSKVDLILKIVLKPYLVRKKLAAQEIIIYVNGHKLKRLAITKPRVAEYQLVIPQQLLAGPELQIVFDIPTATAPVDVRKSTDVRTLGIAVKSLVLEKNE
ncbi:sulfatase-like hydrolase/transferase [candidate division CSSED10-310 bacterium]|uniref:Sulfatase-like hydrolase/transferase n=1 Tax=candidate division CSSED10-310 bacterium TaxID=2855610 RepID=A0ABV6YRP7_UNCC1